MECDSFDKTLRGDYMFTFLLDFYLFISCSLQIDNFADVNTTLILNWESRFNICLGIARGLMYLHSKSVVHCNLNSSNVLLDPTLKPKISNTGLVIKGIEEEHRDKLKQAYITKREINKFGASA